MGKSKLEAIAGRGYFSGPEIKACEEAGITSYVPKPMTNSKAAGRFSRNPAPQGPARRRKPRPPQPGCCRWCSHPGIRAATSPARGHCLSTNRPMAPPAGVAGGYEGKAFSHSPGRKQTSLKADGIKETSNPPCHLEPMGVDHRGVLTSLCSSNSCSMQKWVPSSSRCVAKLIPHGCSPPAFRLCKREGRQERRTRV
jgi:hypothetical protein